MNEREQIIADLGENLASKISAAYRQAFQLVDSPDEAFQVASFGLSIAMGQTAGAYNVLAGAEPSTPLEVAKAILNMMSEASA